MEEIKKGKKRRRAVVGDTFDDTEAFHGVRKRVNGGGGKGKQKKGGRR